jgi:uncharacterized membrane protein
MKYPSKEAHRRSITRSVLWRIWGVLTLALITYLVTENWITTSLVTVCHHGVFVFVYYLHERFWLKVKWLKKSKWKPIARVFTYEVVLGNAILAFISYLFTGSLQQMSLITFIYIGNKYWMYYAYDYIWGRIKWQTK